MGLTWRCNCTELQDHAWEWERCERCGAARDECVRAERLRRIYATLTDSERAALSALREKWRKGGCR